MLELLKINDRLKADLLAKKELVSNLESKMAKQEEDHKKLLRE